MDVVFGGSGKFNSAADNAAKAQNAWSSLPYFHQPMLTLGPLSDNHLRSGLIFRHEVVSRCNLRKQTLGHDIVVCIVASVEPIFDHLTKHSSSFPPVIRAW